MNKHFQGVELFSRWQRASDLRYYELYLQQDLLGDWALTRVWGGERTNLGRCVTQGYKSLQQALDRLIAEHQRRTRHRYKRVA